MAKRKIVPLKFGKEIICMEVAKVENPIPKPGTGKGWKKVDTTIEDTGQRVTGTVRTLGCDAEGCST